MSHSTRRTGRWIAGLATGMLMLAPAGALADGPQAPVDLTVGDRARPLNVEGAPQFGWLPRDRGGDEVQTAYQIRVRAPRGGSLVWDSGKVPSPDQSYVPYRGPALASATSYEWSVRTWDRRGRASDWARPAGFDTALDAQDWRASWIRRESTEPDDYTLARKEAEIGSSPIVRARAYVSASHQYRLYLNGREVDDGPAFSYPGEGYYQATDVTDAIQAGKPLAVGVIYHWYGDGQGRPAADRRLLAQVVVEHADGSIETIATDGTWRVRRASQWQTGTPYRNSDAGDYVERIDAREEPAGWTLPGHDDGAWSAATVLDAGPYAVLRGQEPRLAKETVSPVSVKTLPDGAVVADFGKVIPARPVIRFEDGVSGRAIDIQTSFLLAPDGHADTSALAQQRSNMTARYIQRGGEETFEPFLHWGWRYLEIRSPGPGEELDSRDIQAIVEHTDAPGDRASTFASSDPTLNEVWELMKRSALYSVQHQFVDTPTREKGQFLGDTVDISYATMAAWSERDATQQAIREFIHSQARYWTDGELAGRLNAVYPNGDGRRDIPDYTEMFVNWVWRYYLETGDRALLEEAYPVMRNVADYVWRHRDGSSGLIHDLTGGSGQYEHGIIDWPPQGRFGYDMETVARTTVNILGVEAFRRVADTARVLGRPPGDEAAYRQREASLRDAINDRLRRPDGVYVDGLKADGSQSAGVSQHASSYAIAYQVAPPEDYDVLAGHIAGLGMRQGPMTAHWLLQALADADRPEAVLERLTDAEGVGWANVLARGGTFTWEAWVPEDGNQSMSHGWGAQAAVDVLESMLGIRLAAPGAAEVAIVPPRTGLQWARGTRHTQRGPVSVDWKRAREDMMRLEADVPVNVEARVELPLGGGRRYVGVGPGRPRFLGVRDGRAVFEVGSGRSRFVPLP